MSIEEVMLNYLLDNNVEAYIERPEEKPDTYVLIDKTGGTCANLIETSTIAFQSMAPTLAEASSLNDQVKELINTADTLPTVRRSPKIHPTTVGIALVTIRTNMQLGGE